MADQNNPLIDLGALAEPVRVLIERVSEGVGGIFRPSQIRRVAQAEAEADKIRAISDIQINELQQRALNRFLVEEAAKQKNIEEITRKALPEVSPTAKPEAIEKDWIVDFFDKARLVSDDQMQDLWAGVLAGEANSPGSYAKRTVHLLASLDKKDADLFAKLCNFTWIINETPIPLIFDYSAQVYEQNGITFPILTHLNDIGLISREPFSGYRLNRIGKAATASYQGDPFKIEFVNDKDNELVVGQIMFTEAGEQLARMCKPYKIETFVQYIVAEWIKIGIKVYK